MNASAPAPAIGRLPPDWARPMQDPECFAAEQARFAHVWTFLGLTTDLAADGDWFRTSIGMRSVFVQRMHGQLKGFENRCAHRSYPIRVADRGNGPIVCGLHGWRYDDEGRAQGIPRCQQVFGVVSRALNAGLAPIDIAVCGSLVFGRFPGPLATESLESFLGVCFPILSLLSRHEGRPLQGTRVVEAHWKLCMHLSLDDYHLAAVHPTTLGKGGRYLDPAKIGYSRAGSHSVFHTASTGLDEMVAALSRGPAHAMRYLVVHLMPGLTLSHFRLRDGYCLCVLSHYAPIGQRRSVLRFWTFSSPLGREATLMPRLLRPLREWVLRRISMYFSRRVFGEDALAAERLQTNAMTFTDAALIGRLEQRVAWYEDAYRDIMQGKPAGEPDPPGAGSARP